MCLMRFHIDLRIRNTLELEEMGINKGDLIKLNNSEFEYENKKNIVLKSGTTNY